MTCSLNEMESILKLLIWHILTGCLEISSGGSRRLPSLHGLHFKPTWTRRLSSLSAPSSFRRLRAPSPMAASSVTSTLHSSSVLSLQPCRYLNHLDGQAIFPARSSVDFSKAWLSSSPEKPLGSIKLSSSRRCDLLATFAVSGSKGKPFSRLSIHRIWNIMEKNYDTRSQSEAISDHFDLWKQMQRVLQLVETLLIHWMRLKCSI